MIHQPLGSAQGQAADMEIQCNEILHHKLTLSGYLSNFTGQSIEKITEDTDRYVGTHGSDFIAVSCTFARIDRNIVLCDSSPCGHV